MIITTTEIANNIYGLIGIAFGSLTGVAVAYITSKSNANKKESVEIQLLKKDLEVIGKWKTNGNKKPDNNNGNNHTKTKYKKWLREVWNEDKQKWEKPPSDTKVNGVSGWNNRDIT